MTADLMAERWPFGVTWRRPERGDLVIIVARMTGRLLIEVDDGSLTWVTCETSSTWELA